MNGITPEEIVRRVEAVKGGYSLAAFYRHKQTLHLAPLGARQRPQQYPEDTANRILAHLGLSACVQVVPKATQHHSRLLSVKQLKAARPAKKGGAK